MQVQAKQAEAGGEGEAERAVAERLLRPAISCPGCGARPALRLTAEAVREAYRHAPEAVLGTYQCQRRRCGQVYAIPARAVQQAS